MTNNSTTQSNELQVIDVDKLKPQEIEKATQIAGGININDSQTILQYGISAQSSISEFSNTILSNVKTKDSGQIGETLIDLSSKIKELKINSLGSNSFLSKMPLIGNLVNSVKKFINRYEKVSTHIDRIVNQLEKTRMQLIKDVAMFDELYVRNLDYLKELDIYIAAGQLKLKEVFERELPMIEQEARASNDPAMAQRFQDFKQIIHRFEKKIHDLKLSRAISIQTAPQIRLIQNNDQMLVERIQSSILNTIPLWKNQVVIAIGIFRLNKALELQKSITKTTNELLSKNSELLKTTSIETAKENEKGIVEIETLKKVNEDLISTIEETIAIQKEGRTKRQQAEIELTKIEHELKTKLKDLKND